MSNVRRLPNASTEAAESVLLRQQLARVETAFYDDKTRPTDLKALSVEMTMEARLSGAITPALLE